MPLPIAQSPSENKQKKTYRILGIAAGKGGVGKSTVTVNLALSLQERGFNVGIFDADIYGPSIRKMLPELQLPQRSGDQILPAQCYGIKTISMAFFRPEAEAAAVRAPIANGIISQFIQGVNWGDLDYLLIDFPPGTGDIQLTLTQQLQIDGAILVTTPQEVAMLDVRKAASHFQQVSVPLLGIIENMSYYKQSPDAAPLYLFGQGGGKVLADSWGIPLLGSIPIDPAVSYRGDRGFSLFVDDGNGPPPAAEAFREATERLLERLQENMTKPSARQIKNIVQDDLQHIVIRWTDGVFQKFNNADIQRNCPCAGCTEKPPHTSKEVRILQSTMVGQYAIRFDFSQGCSNGIYTFDKLYALGEKL